MNPLFKGAGVAIVTPFNPDGSINFEKFGQLIDFQIDNGTDAIIVAGTTGESPTLSPSEHSELIRYAVVIAKSRVPVIAGTGSNDTYFAIEHSVQAQKDGADGLLMVTPYYNKTSQKGLVKHYEAIAAKVDLPIILYNVPSRTGLNILPKTYLELTKIPNIIATKEASGNISQIAETRALCGDSLPIYSGNDDQIVPIMALGGRGVISVISNIIPKETREICALCFDGKYEEAANLQISLIPFISAMFMDVNPIPVKQAMNILGYGVGDLRLPLYGMDASGIEKLTAVLKEFKLLK